MNYFLMPMQSTMVVIPGRNAWLEGVQHAMICNDEVVLYEETKVVLSEETNVLSEETNLLRAQLKQKVQLFKTCKRKIKQPTIKGKTKGQTGLCVELGKGGKENTAEKERTQD